MNEDMKEVVEKLKANDNIETGEDGGVILSTLEDNLEPIVFQPLGLFRHPSYDPSTKEYSLKGTLCRLNLIIYDWEEYKFIVTESIEEDVSPGGTCYFGTVELFYKGEE